MRVGNFGDFCPELTFTVLFWTNREEKRTSLQMPQHTKSMGK